MFQITNDYNYTFSKINSFLDSQLFILVLEYKTSELGLGDCCDCLCADFTENYMSPPCGSLSTRLPILPFLIAPVYKPFHTLSLSLCRVLCLLKCANAYGPFTILFLMDVLKCKHATGLKLSPHLNLQMRGSFMTASPHLTSPHLTSLDVNDTLYCRIQPSAVVKEVLRSLI